MACSTAAPRLRVSPQFEERSAQYPALLCARFKLAARTSFVTKCEKDAAVKCDLAATEKKLSGAAKASNVKKCTRETGPAA